MNLLDLPPDIIRKIFGHGADIEYDVYTDHPPDSAQLTDVMSNFVGWHVCSGIRDILGVQNTSDAAGLAAYTGQFAVCKWAVDYGYFPKNGNDMCINAVYSGSLGIIRWAQSRGYAPTAKVVRTAARVGNFDIFKHYAGLIECYSDIKLFAAAMIGGNTNILNYIYQKGPFRYSDRMIPKFIFAPISSFEWALSYSYFFDTLGFYAMDVGRIDLLDWLYDDHREWFNKSLSRFTGHNIVCHDSAPIVNWFLKRGIITAREVETTAIQCGCTNILHDIFSHAVRTTMHMWMINTEYIKAVKIARSYGHYWPENTAEIIVRQDTSHNLWEYTPKFLMFMKEDKYPLQELQKIPQMYENAGFPDRAKWVRENVLDVHDTDVAE